MKSKLSLFSFRLKNFKAVQDSKTINNQELEVNNAFSGAILREVFDFQEADA